MAGLEVCDVAHRVDVMKEGASVRLQELDGAACVSCELPSYD